MIFQSFSQNYQMRPRNPVVTSVIQKAETLASQTCLTMLATKRGNFKNHIQRMTQQLRSRLTLAKDSLTAEAQICRQADR